MLTSIALILHIAIVVGVAVKVIFRRLPVGTSLAWIIIVSVIPYLGFAFYMLIGDHRLGRKRLRLGKIVRQYYQKQLGIQDGAEDATHPEIEDNFMKIGEVAAKGTGFHIRSNNRVKLMNTPDVMFETLINDIDKAKSSCFLEFYIIDPQGRVNLVLDAVLRAAQRGVECKILADHIGSRGFFKSDWPEKFDEAGVEVVDSLPTGIIKTFFRRSDLRNHRKIVVIDRDIAFTGSFNLADPDHFKIKKNVGAWVDIFIRMEGDIAEALSVVFHTDYVLDVFNDETIKKIPPLSDVNITSEFEDDLDDSPIQLIPSGPEMSTSIIYETIIASIYNAQESIDIATPYLIPDEPLLLALTNAARRGVDVRIIVPKKVDSKLVSFASHSYYGELLKAGISLYEFTDGLLHSKVILIDGDVCYLGTVNLDMRSFYLNLEITVALHNRADCADVKTIMMDYIQNSDEVLVTDWLDGYRPKMVMFAENCVRLASPLL